MILLIVILFGLTVGSFGNNIISHFTLVSKFDWKRSCCPKCKNPLKIIEIIPLLGFIYLGGKCSHCKEKISIRYLSIELVVLFISYLVYLKWGFNIDAIVQFVLIYTLLLIAIIDYKSFIIPNLLLIPILFVSIIIAIQNDALFLNLSIAVALALFLVLLNVIYLRIRKTKAMGEGDIKLLVVLSIYFGGAALFGIWLSALLAIPGFYLIKYFVSGKKEEKRLPYGVFISLAFCLLTFWQPTINSIYDLGILW